MRLRFTLRASRQLERVLTDIALYSPQGAKHVQQRIQQTLMLLQQYPHAGHQTSRPRMRRAVVTRYSYVIFYRVDKNETVVHGIRHTSRRPI